MLTVIDEYMREALSMTVANAMGSLEAFQAP
jgi:hypothetical protein